MTTAPSPDDLPPFQPFDQRVVGTPHEEVLLEGVPEHLEAALRGWLDYVIHDEDGADEAFCMQVALRLRLPAKQVQSLYGAEPSYAASLREAARGDLLTIIDAVLYCRYRIDSPVDVFQLITVLEQGGSAYTVNPFGYGLTRRVDAIVEKAAGQAIQSAPSDAADLLRKAWQHAYGITPDPTAAYRDAVRAVEAAFVPIVSPANGRASLGVVCADLLNQAAKWELALVDDKDQPARIEHLVGLLKQLWQGQRSRHAGGATSRDQTQSEAEAAMHLAALAIHWITNGSLHKKP